MNYITISGNTISANTISGNVLNNDNIFAPTENYVIQAWQNFTALTHWMANTVILRVAGVDITFLGLTVSIGAFVIIAELIQRIFYGD